MSESNVKFGFYNALYNSTTGYDKLYESGQMSQLFDGLILDGVYLSSSKQFMVTPGGGMSVKVAPGNAWFRGTYVILPEYLSLNINTAPTTVRHSRIDAVVIELNMHLGPDYDNPQQPTERYANIKVVVGTADENPSKPTLADGENDIYQYPIAYVTTYYGNTKIEEYNIDYVVGIETPYFAWLCERLDISEIYSKWEPILGIITMPFLSWFDSMQDMLGNGSSDYTNIKAEIAEINSHAYIYGTLPKVDESLKQVSGDGSTVEFDITPSSGKISSIADIYVDGEMIHQYEFDPSTNIVTFKDAPATGTDNVSIYYVLEKDDNYTVYFS